MTSRKGVGFQTAFHGTRGIEQEVTEETALLSLFAPVEPFGLIEMRPQLPTGTVTGWVRVNSRSVPGGIVIVCPLVRAPAVAPMAAPLPASPTMAPIAAPAAAPFAAFAMEAWPAAL